MKRKIYFLDNIPNGDGVGVVSASTDTSSMSIGVDLSGPPIIPPPEFSKPLLETLERGELERDMWKLMVNETCDHALKFSQVGLTLLCWKRRNLPLTVLVTR